MFNQDEFEKIAKDIFLCDSPSGFTKQVILKIKKYIDEFHFENKILKNGALEVFVKGQSNEKLIATSAHVDTLGLMVRSIKSNGTLAISNIGGPLTPTLDGEYCRIYTRNQKVYTGTILSTSPASHVFNDASSKSRSIDQLEIRLDEEVFNAEDVRKLGIENGDFVCYDTKFEWHKNGFLKSRFIDDKLSVVLLLMILKNLSLKKLTLKYDTKFYFVVFEEVGVGASVIDPNIDEFVTLDMGCVGLDLSGNEYAVSICAKDSSGPYDYELTSKLIQLAKEHQINYCVDIFPYYGSDIGAAKRAGVDFKGALIGSGVSASHGMERTHLKGIISTYQLISYYLCNMEEKQ